MPKRTVRTPSKPSASERNERDALVKEREDRRWLELVKQSWPPGAERDALIADKQRYDRQLERLKTFVEGRFANGGRWTKADFAQYDMLMEAVGSAHHVLIRSRPHRTPTIQDQKKG